MSALRRLVLTHRHFAVVICIAALALKLLIPSGYMISTVQGRLAITTCPGVAPEPVTMSTVMPGMHGDMAEHGKSRGSDGGAMPCAFAGLSAQALGAVDPVMMIAAIAFVMAVGSRPMRLRARPPTPYLRPPLRGPPALL